MKYSDYVRSVASRVTDTLMLDAGRSHFICHIIAHDGRINNETDSHKYTGHRARLYKHIRKCCGVSNVIDGFLLYKYNPECSMALVPDVTALKQRYLNEYADNCAKLTFSDTDE